MSVKPTHEDGNFIENKEAETKKTEETQEEKIEKNLKDLIIKDNGDGVFPKRKQERSLGQEVGGVEKDYEKIQEKTNKDTDIWDVKEVNNEPPINQAESSNHQSFIHKMKQGKGRNKRKMGAMTLNNKDKAVDSLSFAEAIKRQRSDKSKDDGGFSR